MTKYAILYAGRADLRHLNELELMNHVLIHHCGFRKENISAFYYYGQLTGDGLPMQGEHSPLRKPYELSINGKGTKASLIDELSDLQGKLTPKDHLWIHTSGHGGGPAAPDNTHEPCTLCDYSVNPSLMADELASEISKLPIFANLTVLMTQCHSGGFMDLIGQASPADQTYFTAACEAHEESMAFEKYSPFGYHWIASLKNGDASTPKDATAYAVSKIKGVSRQYHKKNNPISKSFKPKRLTHQYSLDLSSSDPSY